MTSLARLSQGGFGFSTVDRIYTDRSTSRLLNFQIYKYVNGQKVVCTIHPELGSHQRNNPKLVYSLDFDVTPHQLRHTYITNLIYYGIDPKTVQYLAGHENSKITMDIYAKVKYNKPKDLIEVVNQALGQNMQIEKAQENTGV